MTTYLSKYADTQKVPQSEALDETQVPNSAGGFTWAIDPFMRLRRFLILGSEGGTYYASERDLTKQNIKCIEECMKIDGDRTLKTIVQISQEGRAPKNDQAIFALAFCIAKGDDNVKHYARTFVTSVCRTGTHQFMLVDFLEKLEAGWGRSNRRAIATWYNSKSAEDVAYQAVKYRQRGGWSHRDVLRLAHPKAVDSAHAQVFNWIVKGSNNSLGTLDLPHIIEGFEFAQKADNPGHTSRLIRAYKLPREAVKTEHLNSVEVWEALLDTGMGLTALIRNLATMTRIGLLTPYSDATQKVIEILGDQEALTKARIHPMNVLFALKTYESGVGFRGGNSWDPVASIVDALDGAFYKSFGNVEPTNQRVMLALDVSGSMGSPIMGTNLTCRDASAAMALVTQNVEKRVEVVGFTNGSNGWESPFRSKWSYGGYTDGITPLKITSKQSLNSVINSISNLPFGGTDCALPMLYAKDHKKPVDLFVIYTDNETWAGNVHPAKALKDYRKATGINARLVVVGMTATEFSIADPKDAGMMDVVGFDTATPNIITEFSLGRI